MTIRHRSYNTLPRLPSSTVSKNDSMLMEMTDWHILVDVFKKCEVNEIQSDNSCVHTLPFCSCFHSSISILVK